MSELRVIENTVKPLTEEQVVKMLANGEIENYDTDKKGNWLLQREYWIGTGWQKVWQTVPYSI